MTKVIDKAVMVRLSEDAKPEEVAKKIGEVEGVATAKVVPDEEDYEWMLKEVGRRINELENWEDLSCPLRDLRDDIEEYLDADVRSPNFDVSNRLVRQA